MLGAWSLSGKPTYTSTPEPGGDLKIRLRAEPFPPRGRRMSAAATPTMGKDIQPIRTGACFGTD